jgi:hypothetical protein
MQQNRRVGGGNDGHLFHDIPDGVAVTDDIFEIEFGENLRLEVQALVLKAISGLRDASISNGVVNGKRNLCADL